MSPHSLAAVLPLYLIVALLAMIVVWLYMPRLRLAPATSPAMQAAPVAPAKPRIIRYDVVKIDTALRGSGVAIHRAEQNGYTTIEKHDTVITMVKPNGRPVGQGDR